MVGGRPAVHRMRSLAGVIAGSLAAVLSTCGPSLTVPAAVPAGDGLQLGAPTTVPTASASAVDGLDIGQPTPGQRMQGPSSPTASATRPTGPTPSDTASQPTTPPSQHEAAQDTSPVSIGIVLTGTSNADDVGASLGETIDERDIYDAIIRALNDQGALAGKTIEPVYAKTDTGSASWESDFAAACMTFTQDHQVDAVLGYVFNYMASFEGCLAKAGVVHLTTSFNIPDAVELQQYPLLLALSVPTIERRGLLKIDGAVATRHLTGTTKLGVLTDSCPGTQRSYDQVVAPTLRDAGVQVARTVQLSCVSGNSQAGNAVGQIQNAVLAFRSAGVDTVMFHSVSEGPPLLFFANSAESQGYRPAYIVSSLGNLAILAGPPPQIPRAQARNVVGFGWLPHQDVFPRFYEANGAQRRCLSLLESEGIEPVSAADHAYALNMCESLFVYEAALERTGGRVAGPEVISAVRSVGETLPSADKLAGRSRFTRDGHDGVAVAQPLSWVEDCGCWQYRGGPRPVPTP